MGKMKIHCGIAFMTFINGRNVQKRQGIVVTRNYNFFFNGLNCKIDRNLGMHCHHQG